MNTADVIGHTAAVICHTADVICHTADVICHTADVICHTAVVIGYTADETGNVHTAAPGQIIIKLKKPIINLTLLALLYMAVSIMVHIFCYMCMYSFF
jgi:hypothetical protein